MRRANNCVLPVRRSEATSTLTRREENETRHISRGKDDFIYNFISYIQLYRVVRCDMQKT